MPGKYGKITDEIGFIQHFNICHVIVVMVMEDTATTETVIYVAQCCFHLPADARQCDRDDRFL